MPCGMPQCDLGAGLGSAAGTQSLSIEGIASWPPHELPSEDTAHLASTAPWQLSQIIYSLSFPKYCQERKDLLLHLGAIRQLVGTVEALREL